MLSPYPKISTSQAWKKLDGVTNLTTSPEIPSPQLTSTHCPAPAAAVTPQSVQPPLDLQTETTVPVSRSAEIEKLIYQF